MTSQEIEQEVEEKRARVQVLRAEVSSLESSIRALLAELARQTSSTPRSIRRGQVLKLCYLGYSVPEVARALDVNVSCAYNDVFRLTQEGLLPLEPRGDEAASTVRRNHVLRVSKYPSVRSASDVCKFLRHLSPEAVEADLRWLAEAGLVEIRESVPADLAADPGPTPPAPSSPAVVRATPAPPAPEAKKVVEVADEKPRVATTEELRRDAAKQVKAKSRATYSTTCERGHSHVAELDAEGNGRTTPDSAGESHRVDRFYVVPRGKHSHQLVMSRKRQS